MPSKNLSRFALNASKESILFSHFGSKFHKPGPRTANEESKSLVFDLFLGMGGTVALTPKRG